MDFTEMFKLAELLKERNVLYSLHKLYDGYQIEDAVGKWDVVIHSGSYGHTCGLLEIMAEGISKVTDDGDSVIGWLTAWQVMEILENLDFVPRWF